MQTHSFYHHYHHCQVVQMKQSEMQGRCLIQSYAGVGHTCGIGTGNSDEMRRPGKSSTSGPS